MLSNQLLIGRTQSGKTTQVLYALRSRFIAETKNGTIPPTTGLTVIDPKGSSLWLGSGSLQDKDGTSSFVFVQSESPESVLAAQKKLSYLSTVLANRRKVRMNCLLSDIPYNPRPHMIVLEEWLMLLSAAKNYDQMYRIKGGPSLQDWFVSTVVGMLESGLEDSFQLWLCTQDPTSERNKLSPDGRNNCTMSCFGGPERGYSTIATALNNPHIVPAGEAAELRSDLGILRQRGAWAVLTNGINEGDARRSLRQFNLYTCPIIDSRSLKREKLFKGPLSYLPPGTELGKAQSVNDPQDEPEPLITQPKNVVAFPPKFTGESLQSPALSEEANRVIEFCERRNRPVRLRDVCNGINEDWVNADSVKAAADECVRAGIGRLEPNPKYRGSFIFSIETESPHAYGL